MPMLKTIGAGTGSCRELAEYLVAGARSSDDHECKLQEYLAGDKRASRALAFGASPDLGADQLSWHEAMRATREAWGKDKPPAHYVRRWGADAVSMWRTYYHWAISPAPDDHASAAEVAELANRWLEEMWPSGEGYQWIYSVHADNDGRIMHAHVVLNAVNASTGLKVHIDSARSDELADSLQRLAGEYGMGQLPKLSERRKALRAGRASETTQARKVSATERSMRARGAKSWVAEIRDAVDSAVATSTSFDDFIAVLERRGFKVEWSRRGLGFRHPESKGSDKKILASRLGTDYMEEGLRQRIAFDFDANLFGGKHGRRLDASPHDPRAALRGCGPRPLADSADGDLSSWLEIQMRLGPRRSLADIEVMVDAIAYARDEGIQSPVELDSALRLATDSLLELEGEVALLEEGLGDASRALREASAASRARGKLESLPVGEWNAGIRLHRNDLVSRAAEGDEAARRILEKASSYLKREGLSDAGRDVQAASLVVEFGRRVDEARSRSAAARTRLERIMSISEAMEVVAGRRVRPRRPAGTDAYVSDRSSSCLQPNHFDGRAMRRQELEINEGAMAIGRLLSGFGKSAPRPVSGRTEAERPASLPLRYCSDRNYTGPHGARRY